MIFRVEGICDLGCVRTNNEDHILIHDKVFTNSRKSLDLDVESPAVFAVADGMGGHNAGEVASEMVLNSLNKWRQTAEPGLMLRGFKHAMDDWLSATHADLLKATAGDPDLDGMGTTLTGLFFGTKRLYVFNAGDSRLYSYRKGKFKKLTNDHTVSEVTGQRGAYSNLLVNCIGATNTPSLEITNITKELSPDTIFLLCSDGLSNMLPEEEIAYYLGKRDLISMVEKAKEKGGKDNISAISIHLKEK